MRQDTRDFTQYPKKISLTDKAILALWILFLISLGFASCVFLLTMPASAAEINPSVDNQPIQCRYSLTKWMCDTGKTGAMGLQGINGTPGLPGQPNFSAIYYNASNFTAFNNFTHFYNATAFNVSSNYTVFQGASFYNFTDNESYAYLPGRAGGQLLNGGVVSTDKLVLNSTANGENTTNFLLIQPDGGRVGIGKKSNLISIFDVKGSGVQASFGGTRSGDIYLFSNEINFGYEREGNFEGYINLASTGHSYSSQYRDLGIYNGKLGLITFFDGSSSFVGVGTTSPTAQFHTTGTVRFANFGAGTATFDAGGNITSVSDSKAKTNIATYQAGLAQVLQLAPKSYKYSPDSGLDTQNTYIGFIAQDVEKVLPDAVKTKDDVRYEQKLKTKGATSEEDEYETVEVKTGTQTKSLDDRAIIAALVNAVKEQQAEINALNERIKKLEATKT